MKSFKQIFIGKMGFLLGAVFLIDIFSFEDEKEAEYRYCKNVYQMVHPDYAKKYAKMCPSLGFPEQLN